MGVEGWSNILSFCFVFFLLLEYPSVMIKQNISKLNEVFFYHISLISPTERVQSQKTDLAEKMDLCIRYFWTLGHCVRLLLLTYTRMLMMLIIIIIIST